MAGAARRILNAADVSVALHVLLVPARYSSDSARFDVVGTKGDPSLSNSLLPCGIDIQTIGSCFAISISDLKLAASSIAQERGHKRDRGVRRLNEDARRLLSWCGLTVALLEEGDQGWLEVVVAEIVDALLPVAQPSGFRSGSQSKPDILRRSAVAESILVLPNAEESSRGVDRETGLDVIPFCTLPTVLRSLLTQLIVPMQSPTELAVVEPRHNDSRWPAPPSQFYELPLFFVPSEQIRWAETKDDYQRARLELQAAAENVKINPATSGPLRVGVDTEFHCDSHCKTSLPAVVQLAFSTSATDSKSDQRLSVWVLDTSVEATSDAGPELLALLETVFLSSKFQPVGFAFKADAPKLSALIRELRSAAADAAHDGADVESLSFNVMDVQNLSLVSGRLRSAGAGTSEHSAVAGAPRCKLPFALSKGQLPGLQVVTAHILGRYLDKQMQCSNWDARPLTQEQLAYAGADAAVLLELAEELG